MNEEYKKVIIVVGICALFCLVWLLFGGGANVHDQLDGVVKVESKLEQAQDLNREQSERIDRAAGTVDSITDRIADSQERVGRIESNEREAIRLIDECQQIISRVQARGPIPAAQN